MRSRLVIYLLIWEKSCPARISDNNLNHKFLTSCEINKATLRYMYPEKGFVTILDQVLMVFTFAHAIGVVVRVAYFITT